MILDDIEWSLSFLKRNMARFFAEFALYEKAYDFKEYDLEQQNEKHVKMIAQEILINQFRYQHSEQTNDSGLWVLKKPI